VTSLVVTPPAPYSLERTIAPFTRFPDERVDIVELDCYRRLLDVDGVLVLLEARSEDGPNVELRLVHQRGATEDADDIVEALETLRRMLALDEPIGEVLDAISSTPQIARLREPLAGLRRTIDPTPFEGLVSSILAQLISIRGAASVRARLVERFGRNLTVQGQTYWAFPTPEAILQSNIDELCGEIKMTSAKARAILSVARAAADGVLERSELDRLDDEEIIARLVALPGIGHWTAEWFLVNVLGRMSIVPAGDLGIRRSTGTWFLGGELPSPAEVRSLYEPFGDARAYVAYFVLSAERLAVEL
jgi:DNA-3-methyladenine glycosylase II